MKTKILVILVTLLLVAGGIGGVALAAGGNPLSIPIIPASTQVNITNPFQVTSAIGVFLPPDGKLYVGEKIANVRLKITNTGRMVYGTNIFVRPTKPPTDGIWPSFDLQISAAGYALNQLPVIAPGQTAEVEIDVFVAYGSQTSTFQGLTLEIFPAPPKIPAASEKG